MVRRAGYLLAPLPALVVGATLIERLSGSAGRLGLQAGCAVFGSGVVAVVGRRERRETGGVQVGLALVAVVGATLLFSGRDGVHRWVGAGGFQLNASLLVTPIVLLLAARAVDLGHRAAAAATLLLLQVVHVAQPDASQATGVAVATLVLVLLRRRELPLRSAAAVVVAMVGLTVVAWLRPDPLDGVSYVEGPIRSAFEIDLLHGLAAVVAVMLLVAPFVVDARGRPDDDPGRSQVAAAAAYLAALLVVTVTAEFPVLVLGYGASTVLGYYSVAAAAVAVGGRDALTD